MIFRRLAVAIVFSLAPALCLTHSTKADFVLAFAPTGSLASANATVGDTVNIPIYLRDDGVSLSENSPLKGGGGNPGFTHFGVLGEFNTAGLALDPGMPSKSSFTYGPKFTSPTSGVATYTPAADSFTASWAGVAPYLVFGDSTTPGYPLLLGTVHLKALAPGTYTLRLSDPHPTAAADGDFFFGPSTSATGAEDVDVFGADFQTEYGFTVNVSAVPEPGSIGLFALASGGLWWARRRRRRAA